MNTARRTRPTLVTTFVTLLAGGALTGCTPTQTRTASSELDSKAGMATAVIDAGATTGEITGDFFRAKADKVQLPDRWLSEARHGVAELEAQRASAQAEFVNADAVRRSSDAFADSEAQRSNATHGSALAGANRMGEVFDARMEEMDDKIGAKMMIADSSHRRNEARLTATVKEWQAEVESMRSEAEMIWAQDLAEHEQMLAERQAVNERGVATIERMSASMRLTQQRSSEKVAELRQAGRSIAQQADAQVAELNQSIDSVRQETAAQVSQIEQQAKTLEQSSGARASEMLAQARALESQKAEEAFTLTTGAAGVAFNAAIAESEQLRLEADADAKRFEARVEAETAEATEAMDLARATHEEGLAWVQTTMEKALADVSVERARATAVENKARAQFVKDEIDARVAAYKAQSDHDRALAKDQFEKLRAEAIAEAKSLEAKLAKRIAQQVKNGAVTLDPIPNPETTPEADAKTPESVRAQAKPTVVPPDRIAAFRIGLAQAAKIRVEADASESDAFANHDAELAKFNTWMEEKRAQHDAWSAKIAAQTSKYSSTVAETRVKADTLVATAEAVHNRSMVHAESAKTETLSQIAALRAGASTLTKKSNAKVKQLLAQAGATARNGQSKIESLEVQRDAVLRRGTAQSQQFLVEADSLAASQGAVVARMNQEIQAAQTILQSELARLDQGAQSFLAIAEANYEENVTMADTYERITIANTAELTAQHIASRKRADADAAYMRDLNVAQRLSQQAEVDRYVADANASYAQSEAVDVARRAQINAQERIAYAAAQEQLAIAAAVEPALVSRFEARVASTISDRDRAYASIYLRDRQALAAAEQAQAQADAYADMSSSALARLNSAASSFETTAQQNWSSFLATPVAFPETKSPQKLFEQASPSFDMGEFTTVPTDFE